MLASFLFITQITQITRVQSLSSNSGHIDAHVVHMRNGCRNLYRSRCSVLVHGGQHERSVVRRELKSKQRIVDHSK